MEILFSIVTVIATVSATFTSCFHLWIDYKKSKETDKMWDAALQMTLRNSMCDPDQLVDFYEQLKFYKDHASYVRQHDGNLSFAMQQYGQEVADQGYGSDNIENCRGKTQQ